MAINLSTLILIVHKFQNFFNKVGSLLIYFWNFSFNYMLLVRLMRSKYLFLLMINLF